MSHPYLQDSESQASAARSKQARLRSIRMPLRVAHASPDEHATDWLSPQLGADAPLSAELSWLTVLLDTWGGALDGDLAHAASVTSATRMTWCFMSDATRAWSADLHRSDPAADDRPGRLSW